MWQTRSLVGLRIFLLLTIILFASCQGKQQFDLQSSDAVTLYSLDGCYRDGERPPEKADSNTERFHEYVVLGKIDLSDPADRKTIQAKLIEGLQRHDGQANKCFWPRHGLRLRKGEHVEDLLICFECQQVVINHQGKKSTKVISKQVQPSFDQLLTKAQIPLGPPCTN